MKGISILVWLGFVLCSSSFAQQSLEYPGGPTSQMSEENIQKINSWVVKSKDQLQRLENDVKVLTDELEIKNRLYTRLKEIAGSKDLRASDLLFRQALYLGVMMVDIIERQARLKSEAGRGLVAGTVAKESLILKKVLKMAKEDYYESDQQYINHVMVNRTSVYFNDKLVEFGVRLAKFVYDRSVDVQMVSAIASYGMLREALGILNRKMMEDDRNTAFKSQIIELTDRLSEFPAMEGMTDDIEATLLLSGSPGKPGLRWIAQNMFEEVQRVQGDIF